MELEQNLTDQELVIAVLKGKERYFKEIIHRYEKKIFRMAYSFSFQVESAEDLTQEIFMRVFQKLSYYNPKYPFCSWLLSLSTNYLINEHKKRKLKTISLEQEQMFQFPEESKEEDVSIPKFEEKLQEELNLLKPSYQEVFRLYHLQKLSYQEISEVLKKPINTIKTHLFRARAELRLRLKKHLE